MKAVIDSNVLFSALYDLKSLPADVLRLGVIGRIELLAPESVRTEMRHVLEKKLDYRPANAERTLNLLPVSWVEAPAYASRLEAASAAIRDPSDAPVVALAMLLRAPIISGDRAFHPLRRRVARTYTPRQFLDSLR